MTVNGGARPPKKSPLRHAVDTNFHLRHAVESARRAKEEGHTEKARRIAGRIEGTARELRKHAQRLEQELTR